MALFNTVSRTLTAKIVPLHHAGITATLADCRYIDRIDILENIDSQFLSDSKTFSGHTKFLDEFLRFAVRFGGDFLTGGSALLSAFAFDCRNVSPFGLVCPMACLVLETNLDGFVAIFFDCPQLQYIAGTRLNHRYRNDLTSLRIKLRTSDSLS
jgi:hypothetical protein